MPVGDDLDVTEDRSISASSSHSAPGGQSAVRPAVPLPTSGTPRASLEPMPRRVIATVAALIAAATVVLVVVLWWAGTAGLSGVELVTARFDALRTGLSIGVGGGGVFVLYLAWRRQHATEIGLVQKERDQADVARAYELQRETAEHTRLHAERVAATTERDAQARRITDLYAKSVEQLGSGKAPIRHGGLYALERLAQDNPALSQTVVNVLCAYLRAPFDLPGAPPDTNADKATRDEHREQVQEREVRLTAQRILATHLRPGIDPEHPADTFWPDTDLDLTSAVLVDLDLNRCRIRTTRFNMATFAGHTRFDDATFTGHTRFHDATFTGQAAFNWATFAGITSFNKAKFTGEAWFVKARFTRDASFQGARFTGHVGFDEATFIRNTSFNKAIFTGEAEFTGATFTARVNFANSFAAHPVPVDSSWPDGWRPAAAHGPVEGLEGTWHRLVKTEPEPDRSDDPPSVPSGD